MRTLMHPAREELRLSVVLQALSDPTRLHIVRALLQNPPQECQDIYSQMPKSTRSHHFRILREAGITQTTIIGARHSVTIRQQDLDARFPGLLNVLIRTTEPD